MITNSTNGEITMDKKMMRGKKTAKPTAGRATAKKATKKKMMHGGTAKKKMMGGGKAYGKK
jgi:hypothetical protein